MENPIKYECTKEDESFILNNFKDMSIRELGDKLDLKYYQIRYITGKLGLYKHKRLKNKFNLENLDDMDVAYLAGLFDGEGSIGFGRNINKKYNVRRLSVSLQLTSTSPEIVPFLESMNFKVHKHHNYKHNQFWNDSYHIGISSLFGTLTFLQKIYPYLRIKKNDAKKMIKYCQSRLSKKPKSPYTREEIDLAEAIILSHTKGRPELRVRYSSYGVI
jgi:hypothetical protein